MNMQQSNENLSEGRISDDRQSGGIVPAPSRSKRPAESPEGPTAELPASSTAESAIADDNQRRPMTRASKRHRTKPLVVADEKLDVKIKLVDVSRAMASSSRNTGKQEESTYSDTERDDHSRSEVDSVKGKKKMDKIAKWKLSLSDEEWDEAFSSRELNKYRDRVSKKRDRLSKRQVETLKDKNDQYEVMSVAQIAEDAINSLKKVEEARGASTNIKGSLSGMMKTNLSIAITAIQKLATRGPSVDEEELYKNKYFQLKRDYEKLVAERGAAAQQNKDSTKDVNFVRPEAVKENLAIRKKGAVSSSDDSNFGLTKAGRSDSQPLPLGDRGRMPMKFAPVRTDVERVETNRMNMDLRRQALLKYNKTEGSEAWDSHSSMKTDNFEEVRKRKRKRGRKNSMRKEHVSYADAVGRNNGNTIAEPKARRPLETKASSSMNRRTGPRTAAVVINCDSEDISLANILCKARSKISLEDLDIKETRVRRAATGGFIIEVAGDDMRKKADLLADKLREALAEDDVRISRPTRQAELIIFNFDQSVDSFEVASKVAICGDIAVAEVKIGQIRLMRNGLCSVWVKCPLECALKLEKMGRLNIGWASARVELLKRRQLQCFKCFAPGHTRQRCPNNADRTGMCFNCGKADHTAYNCRNNSFCPPCAERGLDANHRAGSEKCPPVPPRKQFQRRESTRTDDRSEQQRVVQRTVPKPASEEIVVIPDMVTEETGLQGPSQDVKEAAESGMDYVLEASSPSHSAATGYEGKRDADTMAIGDRDLLENPLPQRSPRRTDGLSPGSVNMRVSEDPNASGASEYY